MFLLATSAAADESVLEAEPVYDLGWCAAEEAEQLDTAIFTDISPITSADVAIRLPEDQREQ